MVVGGTWIKGNKVKEMKSSQCGSVERTQMWEPDRSRGSSRPRHYWDSFDPSFLLCEMRLVRVEGSLDEK